MWSSWFLGWEGSARCLVDSWPRYNHFLFLEPCQMHSAPLAVSWCQNESPFCWVNRSKQKFSVRSIRIEVQRISVILSSQNSTTQSADALEYWMIGLFESFHHWCGGGTPFSFKCITENCTPFLFVSRAEECPVSLRESLRVILNCLILVIRINKVNSCQSSSIVEFGLLDFPFLFFSILSGFPNLGPYSWPHMIGSGSRLNFCESPPRPHFFFPSNGNIQSSLKHAGRATAATHVIWHGHIGGILAGEVQVSTPSSWLPVHWKRSIQCPRRVRPRQQTGRRMEHTRLRLQLTGKTTETTSACCVHRWSHVESTRSRHGRQRHLLIRSVEALPVHLEVLHWGLHSLRFVHASEWVLGIRCLFLTILLYICHWEHDVSSFFNTSFALILGG